MSKLSIRDDIPMPKSITALLKQKKRYVAPNEICVVDTCHAVTLCDAEYLEVTEDEFCSECPCQLPAPEPTDMEWFSDEANFLRAQIGEAEVPHDS